MSNQTTKSNYCYKHKNLICVNNIFERIHKCIKYLKVRKKNCQDSITLV